MANPDPDDVLALVRFGNNLDSDLAKLVASYNINTFQAVPDLLSADQTAWPSDYTSSSFVTPVDNITVLRAALFAESWGAGDWCVDFWVRCRSDTASRPLCLFDDVNHGLRIDHTANNTITLTVHDGTSSATSATITLAVDAWRFVTVERFNNDIKIWVGDTPGDAGTLADVISGFGGNLRVKDPGSSDNDIYIGNGPYDYGSAGHSAYINDFRVSNSAFNGGNAPITPTGPAPPLSTPEVTAFVIMPSPLYIPRGQGLIDLGAALLETPSQYLARFSSDPPVDAEISSWQGTLQSDRLSYLQCVIPAYEHYLDTIEALAESGTFSIIRRAETVQGVVDTTIATAPINLIDVSEGPVNGSAVISGYSDEFLEISGIAQKTLTGARSSFESSSGGARLRADVDWFIRPGDQVTGNGITLTADYINFFVTDTDEFMDVGSRGAS